MASLDHNELNQTIHFTEDRPPYMYKGQVVNLLALKQCKDNQLKCLISLTHTPKGKHFADRRYFPMYFLEKKIYFDSKFTANGPIDNKSASHQAPVPLTIFSIEFEIRPNFAVLWFKMFSTDLNEILHTSRQCNCRDVCKVSL